VLENLNPLAGRALAPGNPSDAVVQKLAEALRERGHLADLNVGQSRFRCDIAVRGPGDSYQLGILVDTDEQYAQAGLLDRYLFQPSILRAFGWHVVFVLTKDWYHDPEGVLKRIEKLLKDDPAGEDSAEAGEEPEPVPPAKNEEKRPATPTIAPSRKPRAPKAQAAGQPSLGMVRYFECVRGSSRKFWEISRAGDSLTVRFGRIGSPGQAQTKTCPDEAAAEREAALLVAEKMTKGYVEKNP
jgi:predicted DNA-binding WGR domain protein